MRSPDRRWCSAATCATRTSTSPSPTAPWPSGAASTSGSATPGSRPIVAGPLDIAPEVWRDVIDVNLTGAFLGARAAARVMGDGGRLIFTGSVLGERPRKGLAAYSASKAGLVGMAKGLALDLAPAGITVNVVAPGWFESPLADGLTNNDRLVGIDPVATPRSGAGDGPPTSRARIQFLASDAAAFVTGTVLSVDGGYLLV